MKKIIILIVGVTILCASLAIAGLCADCHKTNNSCTNCHNTQVQSLCLDCHAGPLDTLQLANYEKSKESLNKKIWLVK